MQGARGRPSRISGSPSYGSMQRAQPLRKCLVGLRMLMLDQMANDRVVEEEALRAWRDAERELLDGGDGRRDLEANVVRLREAYQRLYTTDMTHSMARLHEADDRRARAVPSTPAFHLAAQDTEAAAADIWEQARHADRDSPQGDEARQNRQGPG